MCELYVIVPKLYGMCLFFHTQRGETIREKGKFLCYILYFKVTFAILFMKRKNMLDVTVIMNSE
jgi:hypothetical protein